MIHFNVFPDKKWAGSRHGVTIHIAECKAKILIPICKKIMQDLDESIAVLSYCDWDWLSDHGVIRLIGASGCPIETLEEVTRGIVEEIIKEFEV